MKRGAIEHPKTEMLASILSILVAQAVGHLEMLWHFTAKYAPDGDLSRWDIKVIARKAGWEGDPSVFIDALVAANGGTGASCGFLERTESVLRVHDWQEHCDDSVHMLLARSGRYFADGTKPRMTRLPKWERTQAETLYAERVKEKNAQQTHKIRTQNALPSPPLPSPPLPRPVYSPPTPQPKLPPPQTPVSPHATAASAAKPPKDEIPLPDNPDPKAKQPTFALMEPSKSKPPSPPAPSTAPNNGTKPNGRPRDDLWDTIAEIWFAGVVPEPDLARVGRLRREFHRHGATGAEIRERFRRCRAEWTNVQHVTPEAVLKHWVAMGANQPKLLRNCFTGEVFEAKQ